MVLGLSITSRGCEGRVQASVSVYVTRRRRRRRGNNNNRHTRSAKTKKEMVSSPRQQHPNKAVNTQSTPDPKQYNGAQEKGKSQDIVFFSETLVKSLRSAVMANLGGLVWRIGVDVLACLLINLLIVSFFSFHHQPFLERSDLSLHLFDALLPIKTKTNTLKKKTVISDLM